MENILKYVYQDKINLLKEISNDSKIDYQYLVNNYLDYYSCIKVKKLDKEQEIYIDDKKNKYNNFGFRLI